MLSRVQKAFTNALFPNKCMACGKFFSPMQDGSCRDISPQKLRDEPMDLLFSRLMSALLCAHCIVDFTTIVSPFCRRCGRMFQARDGTDHLCEDCITTKKYYQAVRSATIYDGAVMGLIHAFKYHGRIQIAKPFGMLLYAAFLKYYGHCRFSLALPVPLHASKLKQRGFNQSQLILREWAKHDGEPDAPIPGMNLKKQILVRKKKTASQTGLEIKKRKTNIKNAFRVTDAPAVSGKRILLIDDVFTTGATTNECAKALIHCGAESVSVLTIARAD